MLLTCSVIAGVCIGAQVGHEDRCMLRLSGAYTMLGYVNTPLVPSPVSSGLVTEVTISGERLNLLVDTGATVSILDAAVAKRLKLKVVDDGVAVVTFDGKVKRQKALIRDATITGASLPPHEWTVMDMSPIHKANIEDGDTVQDGILGMDLMEHLSAVVDVRRRHLLVRHPYLIEQGLQGDWVAQPTRPDGRAGPPVRFNLDKLDAQLQVAGNATRFKVRIDEDGTGRELHLLLDPGPDVFRRCRYEFRGDKLVIAGPLLPGDDVKAKPREVEPHKLGQPKYSVLTFTRAPRPPAAKPKP